LLKEGKYIKSESSPNFPNIPIVELVNEYVQQCLTIGTSQAMRNFRDWVKNHKTHRENPLFLKMG
jgi:hypothetical protein